MSKTRFFVICIIVAIFATSCWKTTEQVVTSPAPQPEEVKKNTLVYFRQNILKGIDKKDSILVYNKAAFLNSCEIKLEKDISNKSFYVNEKGEVLKVDTLTEAQRTVEALTPGKQLSITVSDTYMGLITRVKVSFSKKNTNYEFSFWITEDWRFVLNGDSFIIIDGNKYAVTAKTTSLCYLMFTFDTKTVPKPEKSQAEGWTPESSSSSLSPNVPAGQNTKKETESFQPAFVPASAKPK